MDSKPRTPQHASYQSHRRQVAWQIVLPIVLAGLILVGVTYLLVVATFRYNGEVDRWAAVSTMWLAIPVALGGLVELAAFIAFAWAIGKAAAFIPPYTRKAQVFTSEVEARVKESAVYARRPLRIIPQIGHLIRWGFRKIRGR